MKKSRYLAALGSVLTMTAWADLPPVTAAQVNQAALGEPVRAQQYVSADEGESKNLLLEKMNTLQQEIQTLQGKLEVQSHDIKILNQQMQAFYKDLDGRIAKNTTVATPAAATASVQPTAAKAVPSSDNGEASYNAAFVLVKQKKFTQAILAMQTFLQAYPKSPYAANAHYWLGELSLTQRRPELALQEFKLVVDQYPNSNKVSAALLKMGFALYEANRLQDARTTLQKVTAQYPNTPSARLALARLKDMKQQGL